MRPTQAVSAGAAAWPSNATISPSMSESAVRRLFRRVFFTEAFDVGVHHCILRPRKRAPAWSRLKSITDVDMGAPRARSGIEFLGGGEFTLGTHPLDDFELDRRVTSSKEVSWDSIM
jgi:hypothetical protein